MYDDSNLPLHGTALYNPHLLGREELRELFVARVDLLERVLEGIRRADGKKSLQHRLLVGQRGMGKTMFLRRLQLAVEQDEELNSRWLALTFPEEQYGVARLSDFWFNCLDALGDLLERTGRIAEAEALDEELEALKEGSEEERSAGALAILTRFSERTDRRLLLLIDNVDLIFDRVKSEHWALREVLSSNGRLLFIGASSKVMEATYEYDQAFYDFFQVHHLEGLDLEATRGLLLAYADRLKNPEVRQIVVEDPARIRALHTLTGGNPRTLTLLYKVLSRGLEGDVRADLEQMLDLSTPLYKARIEELAAQAQQVVHGLAIHWDPVTAGDLAAEVRMDVNAVSAQLARLVNQGVVQKVPYDQEKKTAFQIAERFFNIWYLMRASRRVRRSLAWLVEFLRIFYSPPALLAEAQKHLLRSSPDPDPLRRAEYGFALARETADQPLRNVHSSHTLAIRLVRNGKWMEALAPAQDFFSEGSEEVHDQIWTDIVTFFREAVAAGKAREAGQLLDELTLSDRWRPLREALEAIAEGRRSYLERVAPEIRKPAEEILEQLVGPDWESDEPKGKGKGSSRGRKPRPGADKRR